MYSVTAEYNFNGQETFGMLYFANIKKFEGELYNEIEKIILTDSLDIDVFSYMWYSVKGFARSNATLP